MDLLAEICDVEVVRGKQTSHMPLPGRSFERSEHLHRVVPIEGRGGFIRQDQCEFRSDQRSGHGDSLPLATGQGEHIPLGESREPHDLQHLEGSLSCVGTGTTLEEQRQFDILHRVQLRQQIRRLLHSSDRPQPKSRPTWAISSIDTEAPDAHRTVVGGLEPPDGSEERRLPGARRPDNGMHRAPRNRQRDPLPARGDEPMRDTVNNERIGIDIGPCHGMTFPVVVEYHFPTASGRSAMISTVRCCLIAVLVLVDADVSQPLPLVSSFMLESPL